MINDPLLEFNRKISCTKLYSNNVGKVILIFSYFVNGLTDESELDSFIYGKFVESS